MWHVQGRRDRRGLADRGPVARGMTEPSGVEGSREWVASRLVVSRLKRAVKREAPIVVPVVETRRDHE